MAALRSRTTLPVEIPASHTLLAGDLYLPEAAQGLVVFAHGSGSSRHSPRNIFVAETLHQHGLGTVLLDLLTPDEELADQQTAHLRFDVPMLGQRVVAAIDWIEGLRETMPLPLGLFGASTGAGAAIVAAAHRPSHVAAIVSRGGRPDLAAEALPRVQAPTLLLVGGLDEPVIELNRQATARMTGRVELEIVPGATHLFEEPGALDAVARRAGDWFVEHFGPQRGH